jgi:hypothetical protein
MLEEIAIAERLEDWGFSEPSTKPDADRGASGRRVGHEGAPIRQEACPLLDALGEALRRWLLTGS